MSDDVPKHKVSPSLSVRAAAELIKAKPSAMMRVLRSQKYPKEGDSAFKAPYYQRVLTTIRHFFRDGDPAIAEGLSKTLGIGQLARRENNQRAIQAFTASDLRARKFHILPNQPFRAKINEVELRLSPDLKVDEKGKVRYLYVNCTRAEYPPETARWVLEIACHIMQFNGEKVSPDQFEFVDLFTQSQYTISKIRQSTLDLLYDETKQVIELWPEV
jgi:hypothetical protein